jgi:hypothetical protein
MVQLRCLNPSSVPYCDSSRVLFDIINENEIVPCAISRMALEDVSGGRCFKPADMLKSFEKVRARIEALALEKLRVRPEGVTGRLSLWSDDVIEVPTGGLPAASALEVAPL